MENRLLKNGNFNDVDSKLHVQEEHKAEIKKAILDASKSFNLQAVKDEAKRFKSLKDRKQFIYWTRIQNKYKSIYKYSHDFEYLYLKSEVVLDYLDKKNNNTIECNKKLKASWTRLRSSMRNKEDKKRQQETFKKTVTDLKAERNKLIASAKNERRAGDISRAGFKSEKEKIKLLYKGDKNNGKTKIESKNAFQDFIYEFNQKRLSNKNIKKTYQSKLFFLGNKIPSDLKSKWRIYVSPIIEFILPGLGSIMNKEYFKGVVLLFTTAILYFLTFGFASGMFQITINGEKQGGGIIGLITLGKNADAIQPDSRFYLVFGVISLLFIIMALAYALIFSKIAHKKSKAMWLGMRGNGRIGVKRYMSGNGFAYSIATPIYVIILFTSIFPLLTSILIVFTNYGDRGHVAPVDLVTWVGFSNLKQIFNFSGQEGKYFLKTLSWSFIWGVGSTFTAMFAGIGLALLVNHPRLKGKKTIRVFFLLPMAVPFFVMVLYFKIFFGPTGVANHDVVPAFMPWKEMTKYEVAPGVTQDFAKLPWFSEVNTVKGLLFVINIWFGFSGMFLFISGLLQGISKDLYEAAEISGGGGWTKFSKITAPTLLYQISPIIIGAFIGGFNNFGLIYLFTQGGPQTSIGGPGETDILASYVFKLVKDEGRPALAATYMFSIAVIFGGFGLLGFSRTKTFRKAK